MSKRKPLDEACTGSIGCPVEGHSRMDRYANGRARVYHVALTDGQRKTLWERRRADRQATL